MFERYLDKVGFIYKMDRDPRHKAIKLLIEGGNITVFSQIFDEHMFPVTTLADALGTNYLRMKKMVSNPLFASFNDAVRIANYFDVSEEAMIRLMYSGIIESRKKKSPNKKGARLKK